MKLLNLRGLKILYIVTMLYVGVVSSETIEVTTHKLKRGESLSSVALQYTGDVDNWRELAKFNGIDDPTKLAEGAEILIPLELTPSYIDNHIDNAKDGKNNDSLGGWDEIETPSPIKDSRFSYEGKIELDSVAEWNYNLNSDDENEKINLEPLMGLEMEYELNSNILGYIALVAGRELEIDIEEDSREKSYKSILDLEEGYIEFKDIFELEGFINKSRLTIGRFGLSDNREWLFDESLDGLLLSFELNPINTKIGLSVNREQLIGSDLLRHDEEDTVTNYIFLAEHKPFKRHDIELTAFTLVREDGSTEDKSPKHYGLGSSGKIANDRISYWADFAWAGGSDGDDNIDGHGLDIGATMFAHNKRGAYFTLGYAYGSGSGNKDTDFRQTDLQGNSDKFGGVASFKYYGELIDPELSNLHIYTAGIGYRFSKTASVDFIYHLYKQDKPLNRLRESDLDINPDGENTEIGSELDIIVGFDMFSNVESDFVLGYFQPGTAFDENAENAVKVEAKFSYKF